MNTKTIEKLSRKYYNEGYVEGKSQEESRQMQTGFDNGINYGFKFGRLCGKIFAHSKILHNNREIRNDIASNIRNFIFENIPQYPQSKDITAYQNIEDIFSQLINLFPIMDITLLQIKEEFYKEFTDKITS
jgi:hypothetical protein